MKDKNGKLKGDNEIKEILFTEDIMIIIIIIIQIKELNNSNSKMLLFTLFKFKACS